jgi:hypothetical protein
MRVTKCTALLAAALLGAGAPALLAEDAAPQGRLLLIHEEVANPAKIAEYEATSAEFIAMLKQHAMTGVPFDFNAVMTDDLSYFFVAPIASFADAGKVPEGFMALAQKVGMEKWVEFWRRAGDPILSWNDFVVQERLDLSYRPAKPPFPPEEVRALRYDIYYLQPGREWEAEQIAKDYAALFQKKGIPDGFTVAIALTGHDLPVLAVLTEGRSLADLMARYEANRQAGGGEMQALDARAARIVRRFNVRLGTVRPDLSYHPATTSAAKP